MIRHTVTGLAAAALLIAGACSNGDGSEPAAASEGSKGADGAEHAETAEGAEGGAQATTSAQFCASAQALYDELQSAGATDPSSPAVQAVFEEARDLAAPDEVAGDWATVLDALEPLVSGEVDLSDPNAMAAITQRTAGAADAFQRTGAYFAEECGFGSTTTTAAP